MLTIKALHAGDGFEYLLRSVATADRQRARGQGLTDYYTATGTPPGQWFGRGADLLGVFGEVTEAQMRALYGEGIHPDADRIIIDAIAEGKTTEQALAEAKLGSGHHAVGGTPSPISEIYERSKVAFLAQHQRPPDREEWLDLRIGAARTHLLGELGRTPTPEEITDALADEKRRDRATVVGFDMVATPTKSESIQWALLDDEGRQQHWEAHLRALYGALETAQDKYALARRGAGGKRVIDAEGLTFAVYHHWDSRAGDPTPHSHVVLSARVLGSDDKWCALDARALYQATVSLSCEYNARRIGELKRTMGYRFEERYRNGLGKAPVLEIADVPEELIKFFSRRPSILKEAEKLIADYRRTHGHNPPKNVQIHLVQAATLATREGKPLPRSLAEMLTEWAAQTEEFLGDGRTARDFATEVRYLSQHPDAPRRYDLHKATITAGQALGGAATITDTPRSRVQQVVLDTLAHRFLLPAELDPQTAAEQVCALLDPDNENNLLEHVDRAVLAAQRSVYDPGQVAVDILETVARRRATWTETHIRAAAEDRISLCDFPTAQAQRDAVETAITTVRDQLSVALSVDPDPVPAAMARRNGEHVHTTCAATTLRYTCEAVLDNETGLLEAAKTPTAEFVSTSAVEAAIAAVETPDTPKLNAGQRRIVRHLCTSGMRLAVAIGPAGTGKTTAMRAAVKAWRADGRAVIALSPQKTAARELGDAIDCPARTIDSLLALARWGRDTGITAGAMLLVDEAGMASTHNLAELQRLADAHGAVVRWIGDPAQLDAIEAGGALRLIATDTRAPALDTVVRFADPLEAAASLHVRDGDADKAWAYYKNAGRVVAGMADELREQILTNHLADLDRGASSLMMAATLDDVHMLNGAAQTALALRGQVQTSGPGVQLADAHTGYIGDLVVTRRNNPRLRITGGYRAGNPVDNGEQWRVQKIHADGSLTVTGTTHRGHVRLPARYVTDHTELGYASTVHRAQGMTVDSAHLLMGAALGRSLAYVGLTRGATWNGIYLTTDAVPEPDLHHEPGQVLTDHEVWRRELGRRDDNITATEILRAETDRLTDPGRTREIYDHARQLLTHARLADLLDRALEPALAEQVRHSRHYSTLLDTLDRAHEHGLDTVTLVGLIATDRWRATIDGLDDTDDPAAVLRARADRHIARQLGYPARSSDGPFRTLRDLPEPELPALPPRHPGVDAELADYAADLRTRLADRSEIEALAANPDRVAAIGELADALAIDGPDRTLDARLDRLRRDYTHRVKILGRDWARHLLADALPAGLHRHAQDGRDYTHLLDVLAHAESAGLDARALVTEIATATYPPITRPRDVATVLATRADTAIAQHRLDTGDLATVTPPPPLPPEHPGLDRAVADHATDLLHQIATLEDLRLLQQMQADPLRILDTRALNARIRALRHTATGPDPAELTATDMQTSHVDAVTADHAELHARVEAIHAAQTALDSAAEAQRRLDAAAEDLTTALAALAAVPAYRRSARQAAQAQLTAAQTHYDRTRSHAETARVDADIAVQEALEAGAPRAQWTQLIARDNDESRHAELMAARAEDDRIQAHRARLAHRRTHANQQLAQALAERTRRRNLSPAAAEAEQRVRARTVTPDAQQAPESAQAQHPQAAQDYGAEL
ncbi:relaxase domain-containing protein [Nocardia sp. 2]|uniref:Relaxase domain-containing protein n=1 Tax=Nocardia acididurans TaxID=2802282 RepID=A0ABS1MIC0_9NOCA|nr:MobF family relaxase [Nocardia acididurans]MBL1080302.1 relaxase domain-containing protein [Nocardia acididurans]